MKTIKAIVIGAGHRGVTYGWNGKAVEGEYEFVGVADPVKQRRDYFEEAYKIPAENVYDDWKPILEREKFADLAIISTMDRQHFAPTMAAIEKGYDILLEKPISPVPKECYEIAKAAEKAGVKIVICHVLRYAPLYVKLKQLIKEGKVGRVMNIIHTEGVGNIHQSHSFVRGNWHNSLESSPMLLQKSCHDMDLLQWLVDADCKKVQSFGALSYFCKDNHPSDAAERCEVCKYMDSCYYSTKNVYTESNWMTKCVTPQGSLYPDADERAEAMKTNNYGKCVFCLDNDVVDHQTVNLQFDRDIIVTFNMSAFNGGKGAGREIRIMGTEGELRASDNSSVITYYCFADRSTTEISYGDAVGSHGGADYMIMREMYNYLNDAYEGDSLCSIETSADNHVIAFAAEYSRLNGGITIDYDEFKKMILQ